MGGAEEPRLEIEVDPWTRYAPLQKNSNENAKYSTKDKDFLIHPRVSRQMEREKFYADMQKLKKKNEDFPYRGKEPISINGKTIGGKKAAAGGSPTASPQRPALEKRKSALSAFPANVVAQAAQDKKEQL